MSHIKRLEGGGWYVVAELGRDARGHRRRKTAHAKTKREAEQVLARIETELAAGTLIEPTNLSVAGFLERWLTDHAASRVSAKTLERYTEVVRTALIPALGDVRLSALRPRHVAAYEAEALRSGRRRREGGLSARSVLHFHRVLHSALEVAVKWQLIPANPCNGVDPPRPVQTEMHVLDEAQVAKLLDAVKDSWLHEIVLLAVTTGLRRGEILGLRWSDIDLRKSTLRVARSVEETRDGLRLKEPKTAHSRRVVTLPSLTVAALRRLKRRQAECRLLLGDAYDDGDLVFTTDDGKMRRPMTLTNAFHKVASDLEFDIRFHDLRHTHATLLLMAGEPVKLVSARLGHTSAQITLDTYGHILPGMDAAAAERLDAALKLAISGEHGG